MPSTPDRWWPLDRYNRCRGKLDRRGWTRRQPEIQSGISDEKTRAGPAVMGCACCSIVKIVESAAVSGGDYFPVLRCAIHRSTAERIADIFWLFVSSLRDSPIYFVLLSGVMA